MTETRTQYNKLVGRIDDEYYFLDETFIHSDSFKGAVGTSVRPVTKERQEELMTIDGLKNYGYDDMWKQAVEGNYTELGLDDWLEQVLSEQGEDVGLDVLQDEERITQLRALGLSEEEYPLFEFSSGGRCFEVGMKFDEVYNADLLKVIDEAEAK